jgi:hypothetical protein
LLKKGKASDAVVELAVLQQVENSKKKGLFGV